MGREGWDVVSTVEELRALAGEPVQRVADKVRDRLHEVDRQFLAASPFWLVATHALDGTANVSPKGDPPGAVHVLDDRTLAVADRPGNRRVDGFLDVVEQPRVAMLFLVPGRGDTLRVNGRATLLRDAPFFDELEVEGHRPQLALVVEVQEVFYHCSKAFLRSKLWDASSWDPSRAPSRAQVVKVLERPDDPLEVLEEYYGPSYGAQLY